MFLPPPHPEDPTWTRLRAHDEEELWNDAIAPHVASTYRARMEHNERVLGKVLEPSATFVDVGCAQGTLGLRLAERGFKVTLLDVRPESLSYAKARHEKGTVEYLVGDIHRGALSGREFDVVCCTETIEHVPDPALFVQTLLRHVKRDGFLYLTTPNAHYALSRLPTYGGAPQQVVDGSKPNSMDGDDHTYFFTLEELASIVRGVGGAVAEAGFMLPFWLEGHLKTRHLHRLLQRATGHALNGSAAPRHIPRALARRLHSGLWMLVRKTQGAVRRQLTTQPVLPCHRD